MPIFDDPRDDFPVVSRGRGATKSARGPRPTAFKTAVLKVAQRLGRGTDHGRGGAPRGGHPQRGPHAVAVKSVGLAARRVTIKARYVTHRADGAGLKAARLHVRYLERAGVEREGGPGQLYAATGRDADGDAFLTRAVDDPHQFRFIVSPEDASALNLTAFTRDLMGHLETDLGRRVDWIAANHYDTDNPHTHILVRGRDGDGRVLRIDRAYLSHGLRERARALATRELGVRLPHEIDAGWRRDVTQNRWTALDPQLDALVQSSAFAGVARPVIALGEPGSRVAMSLDAYVVGRLAHWSVLGLAEQIGPRTYALDPAYRTRLRALGEREDVIKTLHRALRGELGQLHVFNADTPSSPLEGVLRHVALADDGHDRPHLVLATADGRHTVMPVPPAVDVTQLTVGHILAVRVSPDPWLKPADGVIAAHAARHGGVYRAQTHAQALAADPLFTRRGLDPVEYAAAHARRAARLVRFGLLTQHGEGFRVPADLEARLRAQDRTHPQPLRLQIHVLDRRPLPVQRVARGPAWIDGPALAHAAPTGWGAEVRAARRQRATFLQQAFALELEAPDLATRLHAIERSELAAARTAATGQPERPLRRGVPQTGRLADTLVAASGAAYAILETSQGFTLVPWRARFQRELGQSVAFGLGDDRAPFVRALARGLTR